MRTQNFNAARRGALHCAMVAAALFLSPLVALAQEWPTKPVKMVVGFAPGSSGDTLLRMLAPRLEAMWKQPVIVDNRPGAGTMIATEYVATATDGHTFLMGSLSSLLPKFTTKNMRYDPLTDIVPVYRVLDYQFVIVTNPKTADKAKTLQGVLELSKSTPQGIFFAGSGPTSIFNLAMAVVNKPLGIRYSTVDYNSIPAMTLAVMKDEAQLMVNAPGAVKGQVDAGDLRLLAAVSRERYPNLPDLPTVYEAGYKGSFLPISWAALFAPKKTPEALVNRVARDLSSVLSDQEFKKTIEARLTAAVLQSSPAAFAKEYQEDAKAWQEVFTSLNYKPE